MRENFCVSNACRPSAPVLATCASLLLTLASCANSNLTSVGGTLSGLDAGTSVTLQDNGADTLTLTENGSFQLPGALPGGSTYNVTILTQPTGESCVVADGSGTLDAEGNPVNTVAVTCTTTASLGGTISGLGPGTSVTLADGSELLPIDTNGAFAFPGLLAAGTPYDVTVAVQPAGETCTVANPGGTVPANGMTSIVVTCS